MARTDLSYNATDSTQFKRFGHPGKYFKVITVQGNTQADFTGSNYGYGAIMVSGSSTARIHLSGGGFIEAAGLATGQIYEVSPVKVSGGAAGLGSVNVFKRQQ
jgi:hypothetical protein